MLPKYSNLVKINRASVIIPKNLSGDKDIDCVWLYKIWYKDMSSYSSRLDWHFKDMRESLSMEFDNFLYNSSSEKETLADLSEEIDCLNKGIKIPWKDKYFKEKLDYVSYRDYNTPSPDKVFVTPAYGTGWDYLSETDQYGRIDLINPEKKLSPEMWFEQWILSSILLTLEFNIWSKVYTYLSNKGENYPSLYKECYYYYMLRQLSMNNLYVCHLNLWDFFDLIIQRTLY